MAKSAFAERLARQGRVRAIPRVNSGSPEEIVLKPDRTAPDVIAATLAMAKRGGNHAQGQRAVERALKEGNAVIELPMVEDQQALAADLETAGIAATFRSVIETDLKKHFADRLKGLREGLGMSQEDFARTCNLETKTAQGWEIGTIPDRGNRHLIRMIEKEPATIRRLVNEG